MPGLHTLLILVLVAFTSCATGDGQKEVLLVSDDHSTYTDENKPDDLGKDNIPMGTGDHLDEALASTEESVIHTDELESSDKANVRQVADNDKDRVSALDLIEQPIVENTEILESHKEPAPYQRPKQLLKSVSQDSLEETKLSNLETEAVNHILDEPGELTVRLDGQGWVFRSDLSIQGSRYYSSREGAGDSTHFQFDFDDYGRWNLVFERQDLSGGGSERVVHQINIVQNNDKNGADLSPDAPLFASDTDIPTDPDYRFEMGLQAAQDGRYEDVFSLLENDASVLDKNGARARETIVRVAAEAGAAVPLVAWLDSYIDDGAKPDILVSALDALEDQAGYDGQMFSVLDELLKFDQIPRRAEWLYRMASYLEKPGDRRNLDRAAKLYQEIIKEWPLSHWRDLAEEHILLLKRHYFRVQ